MAVTAKDDTKQVWVQAVLWHPTRVTLHLSISVLVDTGCGGGSYCSEAFIAAVQKHCFHGDSVVSATGRGTLRAANPKDSQVPPMQVIGSARLPILFLPDEKVRTITFRVVRKLPYGCIVGASFLNEMLARLALATKGGSSQNLLPPGYPFFHKASPQAYFSQAGQGVEELSKRPDAVPRGTLCCGEATNFGG